MVSKEYREMLISLLDSEDYYVMESVSGNGKGEVKLIVPNNASWQEIVNPWVQSATGLTVEEFETYNRLPKEEKERITKLAKLNNLKRQVEALEKEII